MDTTFIRKGFGLSPRIGRGRLEQAYTEAMKTPFFGPSHKTVKSLVRILKGCGMKNHARKLQQRMPIPGKNQAAYYVEPAGMKEMMRIWGFQMEELIRFAEKFWPQWFRTYGGVDYGSAEYQKEIFKGDAVIAFLRERALYHRVPECTRMTEPGEGTYFYLARQGYDVWIPFD